MSPNDRHLERAIVLTLLAWEKDGMTEQELAHELNISSEELGAPVGSLVGEGLVGCKGGLLSSSPALRRLDELDLISI